MLRLVLALIGFVVVTLPGLVLAQSTTVTPVGTYDVRWTAMCPTDGDLSGDTYRPGGAVIESGRMQVIVDAVTYSDGSTSHWQARNAVDGSWVWGYATDGQVQDLSMPWPAACESYFCRSGSCTFGTFDWDAARAVDDAPYRSFSIEVPGTWSGIIGSMLGVRALTAAITSPANGATVSDTVSVAMEATGWNATSTLALAVDGQTIWTSAAGVSSASFDWDTRTVANGAHRLTLTATDRSGRTATASIVVNVSNAAARTVTITAPASGQVVSGTTPIRVQTTGFTGSRTWSFLVDGRQWQTTTTTSDSFVVWFNTTRVVNGTHTFTVRITQGGVVVEDSVQVVVNN